MENKTGKYFRYAIGEIILVVIGILIALYLNNLNEQYSIHKQQENYLILVKREMISNIKSLEKENMELSEALNSTKKLLNISNSDVQRIKLSESELSKILSSTIGSDIFVQYENGARNQIIFSGGLKDIKNDSIRGILASWEAKIGEVRLQEGQVNVIIEKIKSFISKYGDVRSIIDDVGYSKLLELDLSTNKSGNKNLLKFKEFENIIFELIITGNVLQQSVYSDFESEMQSLVELINQELNKK